MVRPRDRYERRVITNRPKVVHPASHRRRPHLDGSRSVERPTFRSPPDGLAVLRLFRRATKYDPKNPMTRATTARAKSPSTCSRWSKKFRRIRADGREVMVA